VTGFVKIAFYTLLIFVLALGVYWGTALAFDATATPDVAYFNHLALAFLQGHTYLAAPPVTHDLTQFAGHWYVPFPPLPALLMLPMVWWGGIAGVNTVFFCALFGALNAALIYLILVALGQRGWSQLNRGDNLWLTLLFGLGTVHWYMATLGSVWFVAQVCTVTFVALAVWLAISTGSAWLAGGALALAMLARPNVALTWPLLLGIAAQQQRQAGGSINWRALSKWALLSVIPLLLALAGLLGYTALRFGNPLDFGYLTENIAEELATKLHVYGQFHWHHVPENFWAMWLAGPQWDVKRNIWRPDPDGMSLLLTTPALIYLVCARPRNPLVLGGWIAFGLLLIPLLLYYNTGWWQFGYRFSLDFMVPVMVLLAVAAGERVSKHMRLLILAGVLVNLYGVVWWHS
jgi:hypothetical protein